MWIKRNPKGIKLFFIYSRWQSQLQNWATLKYLGKFLILFKCHTTSDSHCTYAIKTAKSIL